MVAGRCFVALAIVIAAGGRGNADPDRIRFLDADVGLGIASVDASQGLCGSYAAPSGARAMGRGGIGGGVFVSDTLALVGRAHATDAPSSGASSFSLFIGFGLQLRMAQLSGPRDYVYAELVPGYELSATPEVGNNGSPGLATRVGIYRSMWSLALAATLQIDNGSRAYTQQDIAFVVGVRL